jgi:NAD(P) transhydrogenase subunit alpha
MADPFPSAVDQLRQAVDQLGARVDALSAQAQALAASNAAAHDGGGSFLIMGLTVFVLALFVGYYVVWHVTPALHSPLMSVTNAISSVIIVGALIAAGTGSGASSWFGFFAVILASVNIFGGFIVTQRMLQMFKKRETPKTSVSGAGAAK